MGAAVAAQETLSKIVPLRGRHRLDLVANLAAGELSHAQLAVKFDRHIQSIHQFSARNAREIAEARQHIQDQLGSESVGLWVAFKRNRLATYQQLLEDLDQILADSDATDHVKIKASREMREILSQVAQELGELSKDGRTSHLASRFSARRSLK